MNKIIYILILFVISINAQAWSIKKIKGNASISRSGEIIPAQEGFSLISSDVIETSAQSRILIEEGANRVWLGAKTKFKLGSIEKNRGKAKTQSLNLLYGKIRSAVKKKADDRVQLKFKTPTAVAGVRGTEFFIESTDSGEFFCTLDGSIEVATNEGGNYVVDEGKGLRLAQGDVPNLSGTSSQLVNRWVAETSFEKESYVVEGQYDLKRQKRLWKDNTYYGGFGWAYYCGSKNTDFDDSQSDSKMECYRYYLSPFVQFGTEKQFFVRPAIIGTDTDDASATIDTVPWKSGTSETAVTLAEAYYEDSAWGWRFRLGLQDVHWTDGALLSTQSSSIEPQTHLAFRVFGNIGNWEVEFLGGPGLKDDDPLMGHTHIKTLGVKTKIPNDNGELFVLHANFDEIGSNPPSYAHMYFGHEILNLGYYINKDRNKWDYALSYIYQDHGTHHDTNNMRGEAQGDMVDITLGRQLNFARPTRISVRWLKASRNYIPVLEDYYTVSNSTVINQRINIEQYRAKLGIQITEAQRAGVEYIMSSQVSSNGFANYGNANKGDDIATEMSVFHAWDINSQWKWVNTFWQINPESTLGKDSAHGLNSRISFSL